MVYAFKIRQYDESSDFRIRIIFSHRLVFFLCPGFGHKGCGNEHSLMVFAELRVYE